MKQFNVVIVILVGCLLLSCSSVETDSNPLGLPWDSIWVTEEPGREISILTDRPDDVPHIIIYKFKKPAYKNDMVMEPKGDKWHVRFGGGCYRVKPEDYLRKSPYRDLCNDYVALDWKWSPGGFMYFPYTKLVEKRWSEFTDCDQEWGEDELVFIEEDNPILERYNVSYAWLDWYAGNFNIPYNPYTYTPANMSWIVGHSMPQLSYNDIDEELQAYNEYYHQAINEEEKRYLYYLDIARDIIITGNLELLK